MVWTNFGLVGERTGDVGLSNGGEWLLTFWRSRVTLNEVLEFSVEDCCCFIVVSGASDGELEEEDEGQR